MKKIKYIIICLLFTVFIPKVYALTYEIDMNVDNTSVKVGTNKEIKVSLKNIQGTNDGIIVCSLNVTSSENIVRNDIKTLNSWSLTKGNTYLFDTGNPALNNTDIFIIPVKVNGEGYVEISNILCSDGVDEVETNDKKINFIIKEENTSTDNTTNNNTDNSDNDTDIELSSNCNISNIDLSEGTIEFDPNITEYTIKASNFNTLEIMVTLENNAATYMIDRNVVGEEKSVIITVNAEDGSSKIYTIYVEEEHNDTLDSVEEEGNNYTIIFIVIICILVLINIYRIIKNRKK